MKIFLNTTVVVAALCCLNHANAATRPVKTFHAAKRKPNGTIQNKLHNKSLQKNSKSTGILAKAAALFKSASTASVSPAANVSNSIIDPDKSLLAGMFFNFAQVSSDQLILTVDLGGKYQAFLYTNAYLGYVNPISGELLYCSDFQPRDQYLTIKATDCQVDGSIADISTYETYSNGRYLRSSDGGTLYYEDGTVMKDSYGHWYYKTGANAYDNYYKNLKYSNGQVAYDPYYKQFYHPSGATLFEPYYGQMKFSNGAVYADQNASSVSYYPDGQLLRRGVYDSAGHYITDFKFDSGATLAHYSADNRIDIFYESGSVLKHDVAAYDGNIYNANGSIAYNYVDYEYTVPANQGYIDVDADRQSDLIAATLIDGSTYFYSYAARSRPYPPPSVVNFANTDRTLKELAFSWASGGYPTTSFLINIKSGSVSNMTCDGGNSLTGATNQYRWGSLTPSTTYTVAICAVNDAGQHSASSVITAKTADIVYPPMPLALQSSAISSGRFTLSWTSGGGNTSGYRYTIAEGANALASCASGTDAGSSTSKTFTGLKPSTDYTVGVCAYESNGYFSAAATLAVKTTAVQYPPVPTDLKTTSVLSNKISIAWASGGGNTAGFRYVVATGDAAIADCSAGTDAGTSTSAVLGASSQTTYKIAVCAYEINGYLSQPVLLGVTTPAIVAPPAVTGLSFANTLSSITANWASGGGVTADYVVAYRKGYGPLTCTAATKPTKVISTSTSAATFSLPKVAKGYKLTLAVCARAADGTLSEPVVMQTAAYTAKTLPLAPAPTALVGSVSGQVLSLSWASGGGDTVKFRYAINTKGKMTVSCKSAGKTTLGTSVAVPKFKSTKPVAVAVCALNQANKASEPVRILITPQP